MKLLFSEGQYTLQEGFEFAYSKSESGKQRFIRAPSPSELRANLYLPSITLLRRPVPFGGTSAELAVEFSAPKLLFGNNFAELSDGDFDTVVLRLEERLMYMGVKINRADIVRAKVTGWHPSKNIVLPVAFGCQVVINALRKVDVSRYYSVQKTDFIDGEVLHFHSNSKDIAFYDKLADLRKAKISDKRAVENDNRIQTDILENADGVSVLRFEVRLNGVRAIRRNYADAPDIITFWWLFSSKRSRHLLLDHWNKMAAQLDYLSLDSMQSLDVLQNYLLQNPDTSPQRALAEVGSMLIANQSGRQVLRQTLEVAFGRHAWARHKPSMNPAPAQRHKLVIQVQAALEQFEPLSTDALLKHA